MQHQPQHYETLKAAIVQAASINDMEWNEFVGRTAVLQIKKGEYLVRAGETVERAYFCTVGLFRLFYPLENGKEYNKSFALERDFVTSYGAMIKREPSYFSIQALEHSTVIAIDYRLLLDMMERSHAWERLVRKCAEQLYMKKEERERQLLYLDAAGRYEAFLKSYPGLAGRIPQYHIASYLGISPVSLSRLMRGSKR